MTTQYIEAVNGLLQSLPERRRRSPSELLALWRQFVDSCVAGYQWSWYDFDNERGVRDVIEVLLVATVLHSFTEWSEWSLRVAEVDGAYRSILKPLPIQPDASRPWWRTGVPEHAGQELASDVLAMFGVVVAVVG